MNLQPNSQSQNPQGMMAQMANNQAVKANNPQ